MQVNVGSMKVSSKYTVSYLGTCSKYAVTVKYAGRCGEYAVTE